MIKDQAERIASALEGIEAVLKLLAAKEGAATLTTEAQFGNELATIEAFIAQRRR